VLRAAKVSVPQLVRDPTEKTATKIAAGGVPRNARTAVRPIPTRKCSTRPTGVIQLGIMK